MISEEQIIAYLSGEMEGQERERFEEAVARDPQALRALVEQEKMDAALTMLLARPERAQVKDSILAVVEGEAEVDVKSKIYNRVEYETKRQAPNQSKGVWEWIRSLPTPVQMAGLAVIAIGSFILGLPRAPESDQFAQNGGTNTVDLPVKLPPKQPRDPVSWPFAAQSPWNAPIGSAAQYADPIGIDLAAGIRLYDAHSAHPTIRASSAAPPISLYRGNDPNPVATLRIQPADVPGNTRNFAVVAEDGKTLYDVTGGQLNGNEIHANKVVVADLTGSGMPDEYNAPNDTGMSDYAGSLCAADFKGPIRRVLGAVFDPSILAKTTTGGAHVWPAVRTPRDLESRIGGLRSDGNVHIGTLLAIPKDVDLATIGVGTSGPAYEIAKAFQDYGLYLKRPLYGSSGSQLGMCGDLRTANLPPDFARQLARVAGHLKVVVNNEPNSVGGGGAPGQPLAPEFTR